MTIWTMIAAIAMVMWAISLALAMGPIWARARRQLGKSPLQRERRVGDGPAHVSAQNWVV